MEEKSFQLINIMVGIYPKSMPNKIIGGLEGLLQGVWITALSFLAFTLHLPTADFCKQDDGLSLVWPHCCEVYSSIFFIGFVILERGGRKSILSRSKIK